MIGDEHTCMSFQSGDTAAAAAAMRVKSELVGCKGTGIGQAAAASAARTKPLRPSPSATPMVVGWQREGGGGGGL